jgi:hypothetical protein
VLFGRRIWPSPFDAIAGADVTIDGAESGEALGAACATGDFDGDGAADLAIAALAKVASVRPSASDHRRCASRMRRCKSI